MKHRSSLQKSPCPVVVRPYLCSSEETADASARNTFARSRRRPLQAERQRCTVQGGPPIWAAVRSLAWGLWCGELLGVGGLKAHYGFLRNASLAHRERGAKGLESVRFDNRYNLVSARRNRIPQRTQNSSLPQGLSPLATSRRNKLAVSRGVARLEPQGDIRRTIF